MPQLTIDGHPPIFFALWYLALLFQFAWDKVQDLLNREPSSATPAPPPSSPPTSEDVDAPTEAPNVEEEYEIVEKDETDEDLIKL